MSEAANTRSTRQKEAVRKALLEARRPLSFDEIYTAANSLGTHVAERTVFRIIREMLDDEHIVRVYLPGQPARYEQATWTKRPHFICYQCQQVTSLPMPFPPMPKAEGMPEGYVVKAHEVIYYGYCPSCKATGKLES